MLRTILIILPLFAPLLVYTLYRWVRYGRLLKTNTPQSKPVTVPLLLLAGAVLVFLNIVFLVRFNSTSAEQAGYHYPQFKSSPVPADATP